jgi:hypothetical protein
MAVFGIAMNFSAERASRKWRCDGFGGSGAVMVAVSLLLMLCVPTGPAVAARQSASWPEGSRSDPAGDIAPNRRRAALVDVVPLPKPRPADAPGKASPESNQPEAAAPQPSACRLALSEAIAIAPSIPDIHGAGGCGGEDLVRLEAVVLPDKRLVSVKPAAILRCSMASAIVDWIRSDIAPLAASLGSVISDLDNFDSFECRSRNRVVGAALSEHGRANALDVRSLRLANGQSISLTNRAVSRGLREGVRQSVCARFSTVLGPGSDWYHEDHIHLDLMERRNNYKTCQWNVWDPLPQIAPLLPAARPEGAPLREVGEKSDAAKSDSAETDAARPAPAETPPPTKKRR